MNPVIGTIISYSNIIPAIIGIYRFRKIEDGYQAFILVVWIGVLNEILSLTFINQGFNSIINNNIYVLVEALLITWFFKKLFTNKRAHILLIVLITLGWVIETIARDIHQYSVYFRIFYSFLVVLLSIGNINKLIVSTQHFLLKNSTFLICVAFIIYYTANALVNAFWLYGLTKSKSFLLSIHIIMMYINLFTNLLFALAVLWIPKKQPSILPY